LPGGKLELKPQHRWISAGEACEDLQELTAAEKKDTKAIGTDLRFWRSTQPGCDYRQSQLDQTGKGSFFQHYRIHAKRPSSLSANSSLFTHWSECRSLTFREWKRLGSFPDDYHAKTDKIGKYMIGMSVPPKMTEQVAKAVIEQWLS
jgi:site-specific DNA-cytosine methylase